MILRRLTENLRAQNWTAISIEFLIVVVGVFMGTQVSNWNQGRIDQRETERLLVNLRPELQGQLNFMNDVRAYYGVTRKFAERALAGWAGNTGVSDNEFVIAAYQASQITGIGTNAENWALTFGGEQLRNIEDQQVRRNLEVILTADYSPIGLNSAATPYREQIRRIVPIAVQDRIRRQCGDRITFNEAFGFIQVMLPQRCSVILPSEEVTKVAAALRARPELAKELNWHLATIAVTLLNVDLLERPIRELHRDLTAKTSERSTK